MKILILSDGQQWVVDRVTRTIIAGLPDLQFTHKMYTDIAESEFVRLANQHDLVHYQNTDIRPSDRAWAQITTPMLVSVRSHRYPARFKQFLRRFSPKLHVINKDLAKEFPAATFIPNGIFDIFKQPFRVGSISQGFSRPHKGISLIAEACKLENVVFDCLDGGQPISNMPRYYRSLNLYVCASKSEGHSTCVLEALALGVPVASTNVGYARDFPGVEVIDRSVESIRAAIARHDTGRHLKGAFWSDILPRYREMYLSAVGGKASSHD
jgi:glycosyltransferase involved in cell wall biosynthesis